MNRDPNRPFNYGGTGSRLYEGFRILFRDDYTEAGGNVHYISDNEDRFEPGYVEMFWRYRTEQEEREELEGCYRQRNYTRNPGNLRVLPYFWPEKEEQHD